jgi:hypothetical protein
VFSRAWGTLSPGEIAQHATALKADARFASDFRQLLDFRAVKQMGTNGQGMRELAAMNPFERDSLRAVVVSSSLIFGLTRMYQVFSDTDPNHLRLFPELTEALEWLGLDPASPWPAHEDWVSIPEDQDAG